MKLLVTKNQLIEKTNLFFIKFKLINLILSDDLISVDLLLVMMMMIRTAIIFRPLNVQTKCTLYTVHIPMLNDGNFVHGFSKYFFFLKICTPLKSMVYITTALSATIDSNYQGINSFE